MSQRPQHPAGASGHLTPSLQTPTTTTHLQPVSQTLCFPLMPCAISAVSTPVRPHDCSLAHGLYHQKSSKHMAVGVTKTSQFLQLRKPSLGSEPLGLSPHVLSYSIFFFFNFF